MLASSALAGCHPDCIGESILYGFRGQNLTLELESRHLVERVIHS